MAEYSVLYSEINACEYSEVYKALCFFIARHAEIF